MDIRIIEIYHIEQSMERVLEVLEQKSLPSIDLIRELCRQVSNTLVQEPNVLRIDPGVKVVGALYGQYFDLLQIINDQSPSNYLFLGNYINYGNFSLETILLLFSLKVKCPDKVSLLRGAQETRQLSIDKGFLEEVYERYGNDEAWKSIESVFQYLPLAAVIGDSILAVSGGVGDYTSLNEMRVVSRCSKGVEESGLIWDSTTSQLSFGKQMGLEEVKRFLTNNKLKMMIRGNGVYKQGYERLGNEVLSICSCPFFLQKYSNQGSIITIYQDMTSQITTIKRVRQPQGCFITPSN